MATEEFIDATIATMKIIGMVPKNGKLCVRKGQLCLDTVQGQAVRRWMNGDSRDCTLMHAKNTITNAVKINRCIMTQLNNNNNNNSNNSSKNNIKEGERDRDAWTLRRMLAELEACECGLQNLKTTYACDSMIIANLDVIIERQKAHQSEVRKFLGIGTATDPSEKEEVAQVAPVAQVTQSRVHREEESKSDGPDDGTSDEAPRVDGRELAKIHVRDNRDNRDKARRT